MLILTRRVGETVMIGDEITVTILDIKGNQVKVGINAPRSVAVYREEIFERIKQEEAAMIPQTSAPRAGTPVVTTKGVRFAPTGAPSDASRSSGATLQRTVRKAPTALPRSYHRSG